MKVYNKFESNVENIIDIELLRIEKLIEEREDYENDHFSIVDPEPVLNDIYECQIEEMDEDEFIEINEFDPDFEFDQFEDDMFYKLYYLKHERQIASQESCSCAYMDYMPNDNGLCDNLDCYDYPEGPDENLCGIKFY